MDVLLDSPILHIAQCGDLCYYRMKKAVLNERIAMEAIEERLRTVTQQHYAFFDYREVTKVDLPALKAFTTDGAYADILASALLLNGELGTLLGDIYLNIKKPPYDFNYFTNPKEALEWILRFTPDFLPQLESVLFKKSQI